jgi:hypothetical protein
MEKFYDISVYLGCIPIFFGVYFWKYFNLPLKIYFIGNLLIQLLSVLSVILSNNHQNTHFLFYINVFLVVLVFTSFFKSALNLKNIVLLIIPIFILGLVIFDFLKNGIKEYYVLPMLLIDLFSLPFAINLYQQKDVSKSIKILEVGIIIYNSIEGIVLLLTNFFYHYFQGKVFDLIFLGVSPINSLFLSAIQAYAYYLASKQKIPKFDEISIFGETVK